MKISIVCLNRNHGKYIARCIKSVISQSHENWELLVSDGGSTDDSLSIIANFNDDRIKVLPGGDANAREGMLRGVAAVNGDVIMMTTSTDGYLDTDWFKISTSNLKDNPELSLVWGGWTQLRDNLLSFSVGPDRIRHNESNMQLFQNWISSNNVERSYFPELNYCVRASVYKKCLQIYDEFPLMDLNVDATLRFHFNFMREGYLAKFIPSLASFGREHEDQLQHKNAHNDYLARYSISLAKYRESLLSGKRMHYFRDSEGRLLTEIRLK